MTDVIAILKLMMPTLLPLLVSAITWVLNTYWTWMAKLNNTLKQVLIVVVPTAILYGLQKLGLDVSSVQGFASSLVALGIYQLGKNKGAAKP
jgi:hypothetical protein